MKEKRNVHRLLVRKPEREIPARRKRCRWVDVIKLYLREREWMVWTGLVWLRMGIVTWNCLSPFVSNINIEHFEKLTLTSAQHKPLPWLCYVHDTFVVWSHGPEQLQSFLIHLNSLRPAIQLTKERELYSVIPFLDDLVIRKELAPTTKVYRKPTHFGQHLKFYK
jgi:hypothetical protein